MIDTSRIVPEARTIVEKAALVYMHHTSRDFVGLIAHGSAVKGGFIPGSSDVDLQLYLREEAFSNNGRLPLDLAIAIHRDLSRIDPAPFSAIQCVALPGRLPEGWSGPVPGAYQLVAGRLAVPEATVEQLRADAPRLLAALDPEPQYFIDGLLDHGPPRLAFRVRWLSTLVWPSLYNLLVLRGADPLATWRLPKPEAIEALPAETRAGELVRRFYASVRAYHAQEHEPGAALDIIATGRAFLREARDEAIARENQP